MATIDDRSGAFIHAELLPGDEAPKEARRALASLAENLPDDLTRKLVLVASELVTNSVRHAAAADARIELDAMVDGGLVRLSVRDRGSGFKAAADSGGEEVGGWGLKVVDQLVDRWWIERNDGTRVICELSRAG
jgi:anti-sigma regulatory factor (Ser/Thr protein kinase)